MPSIRDVDVVIVGGGIAGSSLAAALASTGLGVVVVERERRFRDRVRGESIHPRGVGVARELGLLDVLAASGGRPLPLWQDYEGRELHTAYGWQDRAPEGLSEWAIYHPRMQEGLLAHAESVGAEVARPARAEGVTGGARPEVDVFRAYARWFTTLLIERGPEADRRRERVARARELDPTIGGFARLRGYGADGLVADDAARRHFFGEDLAG